ncbi:MAG TPA: hypothetical protein VKM72_04480 [Thermoanaerobaculia bacterium]|nr:hypothetical protein [Thermoanaerobaculia bacterium]
MTAGRLAALAMADPDDADWGLPVLYLRSPDGLLFPAAAERAEDRARIRIEIRQRAARLLGVLTGVAAGEIDGGEVRVIQDLDAVGSTDERTRAGWRRRGHTNISA